MMQAAIASVSYGWIAHGTVTDTRTTGGYDTSECCHQAGEGVAEGQDVCGVDTGQTSCFRVTADTVDRTAQSRLRSGKRACRCTE